MRLNVLGISGIVLISTACADWPRSQNIPSDDDTIAATGPLGDLIDIDWTVVDEQIDDGSEDDGNDTIPKSASQYGTADLSRGFGVTVQGTLSSTGWNKQMARPALTFGESCPEAVLDDLNIDDGFYIGDLDFYTVKVSSEDNSDDLALCASVESEEDRLGWDLLLIALDGCAAAPVVTIDEETGSPLGYGLGGEAGTWSTPIETGKTYALLHAGYTAPEAAGDTDETSSSAYRLGVSLVRRPSGSDMTVCPSLPALGGEE